MAEVWPVSLPQYLESSGYNEGVADVLLENQPDVGPPITRRRATASHRPLNGTMTLTEAQLLTFKTFFDVTLMGGALAFTMPTQHGASSPDLGWLVKFPKSSLPKWSAAGGGYWRLSLNLIILP